MAQAALRHPHAQDIDAALKEHAEDPRDLLRRLLRTVELAGTVAQVGQPRRSDKQPDYIRVHDTAI